MSHTQWVTTNIYNISQQVINYSKSWVTTGNDSQQIKVSQNNESQQIKMSYNNECKQIKTNYNNVLKQIMRTKNKKKTSHDKQHDITNNKSPQTIN